MAADRIQRAGAVGHDEVLIQIELFINGLHRTIFTEGEQYNERYENMANQATVNLERLRRSPYVSHMRFSAVERKLIEIKEKIASLKEAQATNITTTQPEATGGEDQTNSLPKVSNGKKGADKYAINKDYLEHLLTIGCAVKEIADRGLLGKKIHPNTIHNFIKKNGMKTIKQRFSQEPDNVIKEKIAELHERFPNSGIREIKAMLQNLEPPLIIQRDKIAKLLPQVDPEGAARRWAQIIPRRVYSVPTPNSLWHLDTHHSLIR